MYFELLRTYIRFLSKTLPSPGSAVRSFSSLSHLPARSSFFSGVCWHVCCRDSCSRQEAETKGVGPAEGGAGDDAALEEAARREEWQEAMQRGLLGVHGLEFDKKWIRLLRVIKTQVPAAASETLSALYRTHRILRAPPGPSLRTRTPVLGSETAISAKLHVSGQLCIYVSTRSLQRHPFPRRALTRFLLRSVGVKLGQGTSTTGVYVLCRPRSAVTVLPCGRAGSLPSLCASRTPLARLVWASFLLCRRKTLLEASKMSENGFRARGHPWSCVFWARTRTLVVRVRLLLRPAEPPPIDLCTVLACGRGVVLFFLAVVAWAVVCRLSICFSAPAAPPAPTPGFVSVFFFFLLLVFS